MKKLMIAQVSLAAALIIGAGAPIQAKGTEGSFDFRRGFSTVAAKTTPAVVFIQVEKKVRIGNGGIFFNNPFDLFGDDFSYRFFGSPNPRRPFPRRDRQEMFKRTGQGSGFLISKDGYILTNTHVVGDVDKITVRLADGREFNAKRIGADPKTEVALIKIESDKDLPYLKAGNPDKLLTGEWVIAIGNPFGLKETLTVGVVSAKGRSGMGITDYEDFIQTDAAINPGNSGGPLLNIDGEVVGINTAIYSRSGGYMGIGFAIPIDMAMNIKDQLLASGKVTRGYVGILLNPGELTDELCQSFGYKGHTGVLVAEVMENGPAKKAGLQPGDIIIALNGKKMKDGTHFRNEVARIMPNKKAKLTFVRDGKEKTVTVVVAPYPEEGGVIGSVEARENLLEDIGINLQELTPSIASRLGYSERQRGVVISDIAANSPAAEAGLREGMVITEVNRVKVNSIKDFKINAGKTKGKILLLRVKTPQGSFFRSLPYKE